MWPRCLHQSLRHVKLWEVYNSRKEGWRSGDTIWVVRQLTKMCSFGGWQWLHSWVSGPRVALVLAVFELLAPVQTKHIAPVVAPLVAISLDCACWKLGCKHGSPPLQQFRSPQSSLLIIFLSVWSSESVVISKILTKNFTIM